MLEKNLEKKLVTACRKYGIKTLKGDARQNAGFPDRIIFNPNNKFIHYVELKADTYYKQTKLQKNWQDIIEKSGGLYILLDGVAEVNAYIETYVKQNLNPTKVEILSKSYYKCTSCETIHEFDEMDTKDNYCACCGEELDWGE